MPGTPAADDLNREAVHALMAALGIDGYAQLAKRTGELDRTYVSRIMRGERPAQPSHIVAFARALKVSVLAITGQGIDVEAQQIVDQAASA